MTTKDRAKNQAKSQLKSIQKMVKGLESDKDTEYKSAREAIHEDPLEVSIRRDWYCPGDQSDGDTEYKILLCTGGPAVRLFGNLGVHNYPDDVEIQYQDWGTPWTTLYTDAEEDEAMLTYAQQFYYGE